MMGILWGVQMSAPKLVLFLGVALLPTFLPHQACSSKGDRRLALDSPPSCECEPPSHHCEVIVRATVSASSLALGLDFLRMVSRLKLHERHARLWQDGLRSWADETLCAAYSKMKKGGLGVEVFWATHSFVAGLIIAPSDVSEVLACKTQWLDVSTPLMTICTGSKLGHRMFGFAMAMVPADRIAAYAISELKQVKGAITDDFEKNFSTKVMAEVTRLGISAALSERRQVKLSYRGLQLTMQTQGISDEISLRWGCFIREVGRSVPRLPFEFDIFGPLENAQDLSADIEEKVKVSRDALLKLLAEHPHSSFSEVCARKGDIVVQCDAGARVDLAIGEALVGAGG